MFVATGKGLGTAELLARVARSLPDSAAVTTRATSSGSWLAATVDGRHPGSWRQRGRWLVAGWPSRDPWGHLTPCDFDEIFDELDRFGGRAAHALSGPCAIVDIETLEWCPSLSGTMAGGELPDDFRVTTTAAPSRQLELESAPIDDTSPAFTYAGLVKEVDSRGPAAGERHPLRDATDPTTPMVDGRDWAEDVFATDGGLVLRPRGLARALEHPATFEHVRSVVVPELVWRGARRGLPLSVPFLERAALDQVGFGRAIGARS